MDRLKTYPDMHVYHYAAYEPTAVKKLMGRHATREEEVDSLLRAGVFVDLFSVVRQGLRASVESYSIKKLEDFAAHVQGNLADVDWATQRAIRRAVVTRVEVDQGQVNVVFRTDDNGTLAALVAEGLGAAIEPRLVAPLVARVMDDRCCRGWHLRRERDRVGLEEQRAVLRPDLVLVARSLPHVGQEQLPHPRGAQ